MITSIQVAPRCYECPQFASEGLGSPLLCVVCGNPPEPGTQFGAPLPTRDWEACFGNLGSNWGWVSVDYRGVARAHTFAPTFTASGRVALPIGKHNSQPVPAFDVNPVPAGWTPMTIVRKMAPPYTTDRFGKLLPTGADPVEAADVAPMAPVEPFEPAPEPMLTDRIAVAEFFNVPLTVPRRGGRKPAKAVFDWLQWVTDKRIAVTPEYEGGFHAEAYFDSGEPVHSAYGDTARDALKNLADLMKVDYQ